MILLDPGHGGSNTGVVRGELVEKDYALDVCLDLGAALYLKGTTSGMTRTRDDFMSLSARAAVAPNTSLIVSVHVNSWWRKSARGADVFHWPGSTKGKRAAEIIALALPEPIRTDRIRPASRLWYPRVRNVLRRHKAPAVLVELGFASNPEDREYLLSDQGRREIVAGLCAGIVAAAI